MTKTYEVIKPYLLKGLSVMGGTASVSLANLVIALILTNKFGMDYYGLFVLYQSVFYTYSVLFKPITWQSIIKFSPESKIHNLLRLSISIELVFAFFGLFLCNLIIFIVKPELFGVLSVLLSFSFIFINSGTLIGYTRAISSYYYVSALMLTASIVKVTLALTMNVSEYQLFSAITISEAFIWVLFLIFKLKEDRGGILKGSDNDSELSSRFYRYSLWGMLHEAMDLPIKYLDKIIVNAFLGNAATGILDLAKRISQIVSQFAVPINAIIFPKYAVWVNDKNFVKIKDVALKLTSAMVFISIFMFFIFYSLFESFDYLLFQNKLSDHKELIFGFFVVQLVAMTFVWLHPLTLTLVSMKTIAKLILFANVIYLGLLFFFVSSLGMYAALLAFGSQVLIVILVKAYLVKRLLQDI